MADLGGLCDGGFEQSFRALMGHCPFPWQAGLYGLFVRGHFPSTCSLPSGLGKTAVIPIWLIALANAPCKVGRRLVYVVNRGTVVDQATREAEKLRVRLGSDPQLRNLTERLRWLCAFDPAPEPPLAISTLRGQFADNAEWRADPARPAVIVGTVDMIGSRLLFSGYGVGFRSRPLHAALLAQDALIVHDEANLEPAFHKLITEVHREHERCAEVAGQMWPDRKSWHESAGFGEDGEKMFRVMELTATIRGVNADPTDAFGLTAEDRKHPIVKRRIEAPKQLRLTRVDAERAVPGRVAAIAAGHSDAQAAVSVFVRTVEAVKAVEAELLKTKRPVVLLTGTMRGKERDELVEKPEFARFVKGAAPGETVYLIATSAGEVGIDISADHMVCDLSTFESMAQRFGRVNRYGDCKDTVIEVVYPKEFREKDKLTPPRKATLDLLRRLDGDASLKALADLMESLTDDERHTAFSPTPVIPPVTDILFDAWAMTTIRRKMPGRPHVEPYLHGIAEWQPPETHLAWRQEVQEITGDLVERYPPQDLFDDYPLKPHELLRDRSDRVFGELVSMAERRRDDGKPVPVWVIDGLGAVQVATLDQLVDKKHRGRINNCTIILPPGAGGLTSGMLDGQSDNAEDVADIPPSAQGSQVAYARIRLWSDDPDYDGRIANMLRIRSIVPDDDDDQETRRTWDWYESLPLEGGRTANRPVRLDTHIGDVETQARSIADRLSLSPELADAVVLAARLHDLGKRRPLFQQTLGNRDCPNTVLAKADRCGARLAEPFRHEFASLLDIQAADGANLDPHDKAALDRLPDELRDLVLHVIAAHHGRARPHFPPEEAFDPDRPPDEADQLAAEVPRRFARLQRRYGRWGLAYLESLLRAADWAASANPSAFADGHAGNHQETEHQKAGQGKAHL